MGKIKKFKGLYFRLTGLNSFCYALWILVFFQNLIFDIIVKKQMQTRDESGPV